MTDEKYRLVAGVSVGERQRDLLGRQQYPLAFVTVSGSHNALLLEMRMTA